MITSMILHDEELIVEKCDYKQPINVTVKISVMSSKELILDVRQLSTYFLEAYNELEVK